MAYAVFLATPLGRRPSGEALHLVWTFGAPRLGLGAGWLKLASDLGAGAHLAVALVEQFAALADATLDGWALRSVSLGLVAVFLVPHLVAV